MAYKDNMSCPLLFKGELRSHRCDLLALNPFFALLAHRVSVYKWQSVGNAFTLVTYSIAGALYANIACKVVYSFLFEDLTKGPSLMSFKGRIYWTMIVIVFFLIGEDETLFFSNKMPNGVQLCPRKPS